MGLRTRMGMLPRPLMVTVTLPTKEALLFEVGQLPIGTGGGSLELYPIT